MRKNIGEYRKGFDMELFALALKNGEKFELADQDIDINYIGFSVPVVSKVESCRITDEFIEKNYDKLLALKIIKKDEE